MHLSAHTTRSFLIHVDFPCPHRIPRLKDNRVEPQGPSCLPHEVEDILRFTKKLWVNLEQVGVLSNRQADVLNGPSWINVWHNCVPGIFPNQVGPWPPILGQNGLGPSCGYLSPVIMPQCSSHLKYQWRTCTCTKIRIINTIGPYFTFVL